MKPFIFISYQEFITLKNDKPNEKISAFSGINYPDLSIDEFKNNNNISGDIYKVVPLADVFATYCFIQLGKILKNLIKISIFLFF